MKKRIISLCLALLLLGCPAAMAAGAGSASDPLVSLSYIEGTYIPALTQSIKARIDTAMTMLLESASAAKENSGTKSVAISAGGTVSLTAGQTALLVSGSARISIGSGSVVNASVGFEAGNGGMNKYQRYIVCEDSTVSLSISEDSTLIISAAASVTQGDGKISPFKDVVRGAWYFDDVVSAYERGLVNGMTTTSYEPDGTLTAGQAVKLAACMHELYSTGKITLANSGDGQWYRSYVDYALENGILTQEFADYNAIIVRQQFVKLFYRALPASTYSGINSISSGSIPDVAAADDAATEIYAFYRAGILTGYTQSEQYDDHAFGGDTTVSRAEVATIMNRMFDKTARVTFTID